MKMIKLQKDTIKNSVFYPSSFYSLNLEKSPSLLLNGIKGKKTAKKEKGKRKRERQPRRRESNIFYSQVMSSFHSLIH
ncbi:hypothetical protein V2J09_001520 [Rumex salicifolius]